MALHAIWIPVHAHARRTVAFPALGKTTNAIRPPVNGNAMKSLTRPQSRDLIFNGMRLFANGPARTHAASPRRPRHLMHVTIPPAPKSVPRTAAVYAQATKVVTRIFATAFAIPGPPVAPVLCSMQIFANVSVMPTAIVAPPVNSISRPVPAPARQMKLEFPIVGAAHQALAVPHPLYVNVWQPQTIKHKLLH